MTNRQNSRPLTRRAATRLAAGLLAGATALAIAPAAYAAPAAQATTARPDPAALHQLLQSIVTDGGATAALGEVREDGRPVWRDAAGTADLATGQPAQAQGRFRIGSVTKTFVSTVVLQLSAEGKVGLDDPVERYLPGVVPNGGAITVRQVLSHTAGIFNFTEQPGFLPAPGDEAGWEEYLTTGRWKTYQAEDLVRIAVSHPPYFAPGQGWHYSNTDYLLAGMLVEQVTGNSWQDEIQHRILRPLGLHHTSFPGTDPEIPGPHAHGYLKLSTGPADVTELNPSWAGSAGAGISTTDDLARFNAALLGGRLLGPAQLAQMQQTVSTGSAIDYGLGLMKSKTSCGEIWGHDGGIPGYETFVAGDAAGHRQIALSLNLYDLAKAPKAQAAVNQLLDKAFCR